MEDEPNSAIVVEAFSSKFAADSETWGNQVRDLTAGLRSHLITQGPEAPAPGFRGGGPSEIIIALGSAGAFSAVVAILKSWLERDKSRGIRLYRKKGTVEVELTADSISDEALRSLLE
jgi:hypothetical protein